MGLADRGGDNLVGVPGRDLDLDELARGCRGVLYRHLTVDLGSIAGRPLYRYPLFTAGIAYLDLAFDLRALPERLLPFFPLFSSSHNAAR